MKIFEKTEENMKKDFIDDFLGAMFFENKLIVKVFKDSQQLSILERCLGIYSLNIQDLESEEIHNREMYEV